MASLRHCPICGQQHTRVLFRPKESPGPISRCQNCGMVFIGIIQDDHALIFSGPVTYGQPDPKILTSSNLADVSDSWEFKFLPDKEVEWPALQQNASDVLQRIERYTNMPRTRGRILDFGSGWGFFLAVAKERSWVTYGLEPLSPCAVYARATFGLNIITDTLRENTFPSDFFDVITSFQVFEHLPNPKEDIQHLHKMLRQDGIILIEVPNFETWTMRMMKSRHRHFVQDHINFYSIQTLSQLLANSGFEVIDTYCPTRRMSVRHLVRRWFRRYLPGPIVDVLQNALKKTSLWEKTIGFNTGDIITVIGRNR
jgi:2-polyprenyl-3-methyl-5-hydroxy-6-metoxy-1,4-benzoquinol methylase